MKKWILIIVSVTFLASCSPLRTLEYIDEVSKFYAVDFTKYTKQNFLITPEMYQGQYESIGLIDYTLMPKSLYKTIGRKQNPNWTEGSTIPRFISVQEWVDDDMSLDRALERVYDKSKLLGADALVNFRWDVQTTEYTGIANPKTIVGVRITGFAIKRK